jgi:spore maturation protein CgeB
MASNIAKAKQRTNSLMVSYNNDNIFGGLRKKAYWRHFRLAIPVFDLHLVFRRADEASYYRCGARNVYVLLHHYLPWLHRPISADLINDWRSDICFLGHCEPDKRIYFIDQLMRHVPGKYLVRGSRWKENAKGRRWEGMETSEVQGEDYVKGINGAKIALSFFSSWNKDDYTTRVFEIPACGTFMLSERTSQMLELYQENKEAVYFSDVAELVDKAHFYLTHDEFRERIANAGKRRGLSSGYDIYRRMREWVGLAEKMR